MNPSGRPRLLTDDVKIVDLYESGWSESRISRELGLARTTIHRRLEDGCGKLRSATESRSLLNHKSFLITEPLIELVDGLLLGDACVEKWANSEGRLELSQRRSCVEWLCAVKHELGQHGIDSTIADRGSRGFQLRSKKYVQFSELRQRWYPQGKKIIPKDVRLTPRALAHWYWGDGSLGNSGYKMSFCTDGFTWTDVRRLARRLRAIYGWMPSVVKHQTYLKLDINRMGDRKNLVELISPFCPSCFSYKLKIRRPACEASS